MPLYGFFANFSGMRMARCQEIIGWGLPGGCKVLPRKLSALHWLARLHKMRIQGATQGATKCYSGCYTFKIAENLECNGVERPAENSEEPLYATCPVATGLKTFGRKPACVVGFPPLLPWRRGSGRGGALSQNVPGLLRGYVTGMISTSFDD